jgi:flavin reductase (DIM6/NTAB) family NADH-FMN oxidoreductase RutF/pimeloyl-ACP methyl ester carboxylesterase
MTLRDPLGTAYHLAGPETAPAVVLIHGLGLNRAVWQWMVPDLARRFRVITYDLVGHGESQPPKRTPVLRDLSNQLTDLLDHLGIGAAAIVGFSLGGMVARRFAQDHPARTHALVILHSPHRRSPEAQAAIVARVDKARAAGPAATVEAALLRWYTEAARPDLMDLTRAWVLANDPRIYPDLYSILAEGIDEITSPTPPIACPALVLTADQDYGNGPEMSAAIAAEIAGARLVVLKGLRHMALAEDPVAVNRPVMDFLSEFLADQAVSSPKIDPRALRNAFGNFATGVTVITTRQADNTPRGFTANSFTSVSLDPPLLLVCLAKSAHSCEVFATSPHFAVNVLSENQRDLSGLFSSRVPDKFRQCDWTPGHAGVPLLAGALAQFACARHTLVDAGDHLVLIGRIEAFSTNEGDPLGYFRGNYFSLGLERSLVEAAAAANSSRIGALLTRAGGVLLKIGDDGRLSLPWAQGPSPSLGGLLSALVAQGLRPEIDFVYAAFDDRKLGCHAIYYHGCVAGQVPQGYCVLPLAALPGVAIANDAEAKMLARFAADFRNGTFGIYHGNETTGSVRQVSAP